MLGNLGLTGVRVRDIVGTAVTSLDVFQKKLDELEAGKQLNALELEFQKFLKSLDADIKTTGNELKSLGIGVGKDLTPAFRMFLKVVRRTSQFLRENKGFTKFLVVLGGIAAVIGPLVFTLGGLAFAFVQLHIAIPLLKAALLSSIPALASFAAAAAPVLAVAVAIGSVTFALVRISEAWPAFKDSTVKEWMGFVTEEAKNLLTVLEKLEDFMLPTALINLPGNIAGAVSDRLKSTPFSRGEKAPPGVEEIDEKLAKVAPGALTIQRKVPRKDFGPGPRVEKLKQEAELVIKVEGPPGTTAKVKNQKGFDKMQVNRGFQGAF